MNRPIAAGHSRGTRQPYKRKRDAQGRLKRQTKEITILNDTSSLLDLVLVLPLVPLLRE